MEDASPSSEMCAAWWDEDSPKLKHLIFSFPANRYWHEKKYFFTGSNT